MFFAGLILVTRNRFVLHRVNEIFIYDWHRFLAWPTIIFAVNGLINQHPLRSKDGQGGGWNNVLYAFNTIQPNLIH